MAIYKFPPTEGENGSPHKHSESESRKFPEFIYIDDMGQRAHSKGDQKQEKMQSFESIQQLNKRHYPYGLRIFTFMAALSSFCVAALTFFLVVAVFLIAIVCFFQIEAVNKILSNLWKLFRRGLVFSLGMFIATFSPSFGFGIVFLYFLLNGEKMNNKIISRLFEKSS